jgi:hypothetical protein
VKSCPFFTAAAISAALGLHVLAADLRVEPKEIDELLANPGMGWQTFGMFVKNDKNLQVPSGSAYFRFYWREIEPEDGKINFRQLDRYLEAAHEQGQLFAMRVMCMGSGELTDVPMWLKEKGCGGYDIIRGGKPHWDPKLDDPVFVQHHRRLIQALAAHYDGHPDFDALDIGTVGNWGEWNMSGSLDPVTKKEVPMPPEPVQNMWITEWVKAFPKTPKMVLVGSGPGMARAVKDGLGWRADCIGDWGFWSKNWSHMRTIYPPAIAKGHAEEAWQKGPVAFESCYDMRKWKEEGFDIEKTLQYALDQHASYLNNKSAPLPEGALPLVQNFVRKLGYRLVVRSFEHEDVIKADGTMKVKITWENVGVAPPYRDYFVAIRLRDLEEKESIVFRSEESIRGWLPGKHVSEVSCRLGKGHGNLEISLGIMRPTTAVVVSHSNLHDLDNPAVRLAIAGRDAEGWYPLSKVKVGAP